MHERRIEERSTLLYEVKRPFPFLGRRMTVPLFGVSLLWLVPVPSSACSCCSYLVTTTEVNLNGRHAILGGLDVLAQAKSNENNGTNNPRVPSEFVPSWARTTGVWHRKRIWCRAFKMGQVLPSLSLSLSLCIEPIALRGRVSQWVSKREKERPSRLMWS